MNRLLISLLVMFTAFGAVGKDEVINPSESDFDTNLTFPEVPVKAIAPVTSHMNKISQALKKRNLTTDLYRDGEIVRIIIPCSELFSSNDTVLKDSGKKLLQPFAQILDSPTMYKVIVAVFADDTGDDIYCDYLTDTRANAIDDYLSSIATADELNTIPYGMGKSSPRVPNNSIANRAANRRVEIYIVPEWNLIKDARSGKL